MSQRKAPFEKKCFTLCSNNVHRFALSEVRGEPLERDREREKEGERKRKKRVRDRYTQFGGGSINGTSNRGRVELTLELYELL